MKKIMSYPMRILTTMDPNTGVIGLKTPMQILRSYCLCDPSVQHLYQLSLLFGVYFMVKRIGVLRVGDPVYPLVD